MKLREIAFSRSGDKGSTSNICVFPYNDADYGRLVDKLTVEAVREKFAALVTGEIVRYEIPANYGLNFVLFDALDGGVSQTLRVDPHGKSFQSLILDIDV
jgi:hypothetical protein